MTRRRSTSSSHIHINHNPSFNPQNDQNPKKASGLYKQAYHTLINNNYRQIDKQQNTPVSSHQSAERTHLNDSIPIKSPLHRPHSSTEDNLSDLEDFEHDPSTKIVHNNRKIRQKLLIFNQKQNSLIKSQVLPTAEQPQPPLFHHLQQQQHTTIDTLFNEVKRFTQTRYPFSRFIICFPSPLIQEQKVTEDLCKFLDENKQLQLELSSYRKSLTKCASYECDILLFVKNSYSFSIPYDEANWPQSLLGFSYSCPSTSSIPPQLSLIVKNVSLSMNWLSQVSSKFVVYKYLVFSEILVHSFKPPTLDYTNRECQPC
jgi:hypothetical protein